MNWFNLALLSLFLMGTQRFLYKVSAERRCNTAWTTFSFMTTVALLGSVLFFLSGRRIDHLRPLFLIAFINSGSFLIATLTHIEALKHVPTGVAYPIIRLGAVVVVLFSIVYFKDPLSLWQVIGIVLAMAVIALLTRDLYPEKETTAKDLRKGIVFVFVSLLAGAIASVSSKFAALYTDKMAFIALSYTLSMVFSFSLRGQFQREGVATNHREAVIIGVIMGVINLVGYYSFLAALSTGPLSIIASIGGMHFVIAVLLARVIYRETLSRLRLLGILLTIISIMLLRL